MKYILSTLLVLVTLSSYSQDTTHDVCMPYSVAKQISVDLISGDSARDMLTFVVDELIVKETQIEARDSIIKVYKSREINLNTQLNNERLAKDTYITMYGTLEGEYDRLNKQYKKQKKVSKTYKIGFWGGLAIGIASYILVTKPF